MYVVFNHQQEDNNGTHEEEKISNSFKDILAAEENVKQMGK